jgi:hypothetical protein
VDAALLPATAAAAVASSPSASRLLLPGLGLASVALSLASAFSSLRPDAFSLSAAAGQFPAVDVAHLNYLQAVDSRLQRLQPDFSSKLGLRLTDAQQPQTVEQSITADTVTPAMLQAAVEQRKGSPQAASGAAGCIDLCLETGELLPGSAAGSAELEDDGCDFISSRRAAVGRRRTIVEEDEEADTLQAADDSRDSDDVIFYSPLTPHVRPPLQSPRLAARRLVCEQLRERERQRRSLRAATCCPSIPQRQSLLLSSALSALSGSLSSSSLLSSLRLLPLATRTPPSLLYLRRCSLAPFYSSSLRPSATAASRSAVYFLTGEKDGVRGEMEEERRDEQPVEEQSWQDMRGALEAAAISSMKDALQRIHSGLQRLPAPTETAVPASSRPPLPPPRALAVSSPAPPLAGVQSSAALSAGHRAARLLFASLHVRLHAPSSRVFLCEYWPVLCDLGQLEASRERERKDAHRAQEEQRSRRQQEEAERQRVDSEQRERRKQQRQARQAAGDSDNSGEDEEEDDSSCSSEDEGSEYGVDDDAAAGSDSELSSLRCGRRLRSSARSRRRRQLSHHGGRLYAVNGDEDAAAACCDSHLFRGLSRGLFEDTVPVLSEQRWSCGLLT